MVNLKRIDVFEKCLDRAKQLDNKEYVVECYTSLFTGAYVAIGDFGSVIQNSKEISTIESYLDNESKLEVFHNMAYSY